MKRCGFRFWPLRGFAVALCGFLLGGCDTPPSPVSTAPSGNHVRIGPIVHSWSADAIPAAGERPSWIAAASHRDGLLRLWALEAGRQVRLIGSYPDVGFHPDGVRWADLESDGRPDLLVAAEGRNEIQHWRSEESGEGLQLAAAVSPGNPPLDVVSADLDADGHIDLVTTPYDAGELTVLWGRGNFAFDVRTLPERKPKGASGAAESTPETQQPDKGTSGRVYGQQPGVTGTANRRWKAQEDDTESSDEGPVEPWAGPPPAASHARIADWDRDGRPDVIWTERRGGAILLGRNLGERRFDVRKLRPPEGGSPRQIALADLDGDGFPDLVAALETGAKALVLYNDGRGGVRATEEIPAPSWGFSNVAAVSGGDPLVLLTLDDSVMLARRVGDAWHQRRLQTGGFPLDPKLLDVDGDGALDLLVANSTGEDLSVIFGPLWDLAEEVKQ